MGHLKTDEDRAALQAAGRLLQATLAHLRERALPGVTPQDLDEAARSVIARGGGIPAFLGYQGFPAAVCVSRAPAVAHAVPDARPLARGEVVNIDCGVIVDGWHADAAITVALGPVSDRTALMLRVGADALKAGVAACRPGGHVGDIGAAVDAVVRAAGLRTLQGIDGHGIGLVLHEDPRVPNTGTAGDGEQLRAGLVLCVEPIVVGDERLVELPDGSFGSADGLPGVHVEHTVLITPRGPRIIA